jgi:hypothetical protein
MYAAERFQSRITASSHATKNPDIQDGCPDAVETQVPKILHWKTFGKSLSASDDGTTR